MFSVQVLSTVSGLRLFCLKILSDPLLNPVIRFTMRIFGSYLIDIPKFIGFGFSFDFFHLMGCKNHYISPYQVRSFLIRFVLTNVLESVVPFLSKNSKGKPVLGNI